MIRKMSRNGSRGSRVHRPDDSDKNIYQEHNDQCENHETHDHSCQREHPADQFGTAMLEHSGGLQTCRSADKSGGQQALNEEEYESECYPSASPRFILFVHVSDPSPHENPFTDLLADCSRPFLGINLFLTGVFGNRTLFYPDEQRLNRNQFRIDRSIQRKGGQAMTIRKETGSPFPSMDTIFCYN